MTRRIAVVVRDRQGEALRMALGLTLMDDDVDVFAAGRKFDWTEQDLTNIEVLQELEAGLFSDHRENEETEFVATEMMAHRLAEYDHVIPY